MLTADAALKRLVEGNQRFVNEILDCEEAIHHHFPKRLIGEQKPFAILLGCSDSRVPAEIVFDQGLGDLFVIRVAGNIVAPSLIGSVEFAAAQFGSPLVVVMGHTSCGAVQATLDEIEHSERPTSPNLRSIVDRIRPAVESVVKMANAGGVADPAFIQKKAVRANIRASVEKLRSSSEILETLVADGALRIVGAEYDLETGKVEFLDAG